jgi:hypothetical protein
MKSSREPLDACQQSLRKFRRLVKKKLEERIKIQKRLKQTILVFKRVLKIQKLLVFSRTLLAF